MVAPGDGCAYHALAAVCFCADVADYLRGKGFRFRIGINSGAISAGIIGTSRRVFRICGDAVNTASRMMSTAKEGHIQCSEATFDALESALPYLQIGPIVLPPPKHLACWPRASPQAYDLLVARAAHDAPAVMASTFYPAELLGAAVCCAAHHHQTCAAPACSNTGRSASRLRAVSCHSHHAHVGRHRRRVVKAAAAGSGGALKAWPPADVWADFAAFHEGAWDSTSCVFARNGTPVPLPDKYTPEAYKEWGQVMHEWQARVVLAAACAPRVCSAL